MMPRSVYPDGSAPSGSAPISAKTRKAPTASDATSLATGESCSRSSRRPTTNMAMAAASTADQSRRPSTPAVRAIAPKPTSVADAMAIPPIVGVGALCQRSGRGGTTAPYPGARRRTSPPTAMAVRIASTTAITITVTRVQSSGIHQLGRRLRDGVLQQERRLAQNPAADCIQSGRCAREEVPKRLEVQPVAAIALSRLDKRQWNHAVEEEVVGVATRPGRLMFVEVSRQRQAVEQPEILRWRTGVGGNPLVADPGLAGNDDRNPAAGQLDAGLRAIDDDAVAQRHQRVGAQLALRRHDVNVRREPRQALAELPENRLPRRRKAADLRRVHPGQ